MNDMKIRVYVYIPNLGVVVLCTGSLLRGVPPNLGSIVTG